MLFAIIPAISSADVTNTTLSDYAYDFASIGYEIEVTGSSYYHNPLNSGDYFRLMEGDYTMETMFDGLSRKARKEFVAFYNKECPHDYGDADCHITVTGEVELDEDMKMVLTANAIKVIKTKSGKTADFN